MKILLTLNAAFWRALLHTLPTMFGILLINFLLLQLAPGDAADVMAGESGSATQESLAALRSQFGLDQSIPVQLWHYLSNLAHFNLGNALSRQGQLDAALASYANALRIKGENWRVYLALGDVLARQEK